MLGCDTAVGNLAVGDGYEANAPDGFNEIAELLPPTIHRKLGYLGKAYAVLFYYDHDAGEVAWHDGSRGGLGTGGWRAFIDLVTPLAEQYGVNVGGDGVRATDAIVIDRETYSAWFAPRRDARRGVIELNRIHVGV
jgi:hypothetical protein